MVNLESQGVMTPLQTVIIPWILNRQMSINHEIGADKKIGHHPRASYGEMVIVGCCTAMVVFPV